MDTETALAFADEIVFAQTGQHLNDLQRTIFRDSWNGKTYTQIDESNYLSDGYAKQVGKELWELLSTALSETVGKKSFKGAIERRLQSPQSQNDSISQESIMDIVTPSLLDPNFVGRESAIADLNNLITSNKIVLIYAPGGTGKTTLAKRYLKHFDTCIEFSIAKETQNITSVESLVEEKLRQLREEPGREFGISLDRLKEKLKAERIAVLIDNLEPALEGGKFIQSHRGYLELLRVLADPDVQSVTLITSRERLQEGDVTVYPYKLEGLDISAWQEYFSSKEIPQNTEALTQMHNAYGGSAKAMEILSSAIKLDYEGNIEAYWNVNKDDLLIEPDLEDLVISQFNRLQQQDEDAYKLLCRLGCYRYQDIPTVPEHEVLGLLWDMDKKRQRRAIKSLTDRALVEFSNDKYWLYPFIRTEAINRFRASETGDNNSISINLNAKSSVYDSNCKDELTGLKRNELLHGSEGNSWLDEGCQDSLIGKKDQVGATDAGDHKLPDHVLATTSTLIPGVVESEVVTGITFSTPDLWNKTNQVQGMTSSLQAQEMGLSTTIQPTLPLLTETEMIFSTSNQTIIF